MSSSTVRAWLNLSFLQRHAVAKRLDLLPRMSVFDMSTEAFDRFVIGTAQRRGILDTLETECNKEAKQ